MSRNSLFSLGERLSLCASMVRPGAALADIGTDHAYLPVWLAKQGLISKAIAADVRVGPLRRAMANIRRYQVEDTVSARLSDGLDAIFPWEADDIVVAGMGGETMIEILSGAPWLKEADKRLILQPMTSAESLRIYLAEQGFSVLREQAVQEDGRVYSAFLAAYCPGGVQTDGLYPYIGKLDAATPENRQYIRRRIAGLEKKANGLALAGDEAKAAALRLVIGQLNALLEEKGSDDYRRPNL